MPPKKASGRTAAQQSRSTRSQRKREVLVEDLDETAAETTPSKRRRTSTRSEPQTERKEVEDDASGSDQESVGQDDEAEEDELANPETVAASTPSRRGRPPKGSATPAKLHANVGVVPTPKGLQSAANNKLVTPSKAKGANGTDTPGRRTIADRSARRKVARAMIDRVVGGATSDDDAGDEDLAREIYESSGDEDEQEEQEEEVEADTEEAADAIAAATPSRTPRGRRKKATTRKKSPTPPRDLPPHETYFFQNKPGWAKTSANTLASLDLLTHEEYFNILRGLKNPHEEDIKFLEDLHAESFNQWTFELAEGFGLCLYGYGSKRALLHRFAKHLHGQIPDHQYHKIVVINGFVRSISIREVLTTISTAIDASVKLAAAQPVALLQDVLSLLSSSDREITVILNSADAPPLRKSQFQTVLSQLAAHPRVHLACTVETPDFPALWDSGQRSNFNFAFHDATTFAPRSAAELEVVDEVHELLGRRARRVGGKDGVAFVLKSLPENAKNLFRLLVGEVLVALDDESGAAVAENPGVEYRMLYNKAVEEFICSSEMAFRTLLKESVSRTCMWPCCRFANAHIQISRSPNDYQPQGCAGYGIAESALPQRRAGGHSGGLGIMNTRPMSGHTGSRCYRLINRLCLKQDCSEQTPMEQRTLGVSAVHQASFPDHLLIRYMNAMRGLPTRHALATALAKALPMLTMR